MKFLFLILLSYYAWSHEDTILTEKSSVTEIGVIFPISNSAVKDYISSRGVVALPFTSGYGNGVEIGRHAVISNQATIGVIVGANMFVVSDPNVMAQIYQMNVYLTGRLYFGRSWRGGIFAEIGSGPELSAAKFGESPFIAQVNIGSRLGAGYNYRFTDDVTIGASVLVVPSLTSNILDGTKIIISMLW